MPVKDDLGLRMKTFYEQDDNWIFMMYREYISPKNIVLYGIEYTMSKWERGDTND